MRNRMVRTLMFSMVVIATVLITVNCGGPKYDLAQPLKNWTSNTVGNIKGDECLLHSGDTLWSEGDYRNFLLRGQAYTTEGAEAGLIFHAEGAGGYEVLFRNGIIDGTRKTGSLSAVRNIYRSLAKDGSWCNFEIAVRNKNISVKINGIEVVCYTEPAQPYRTDVYAQRLLGHGPFVLIGKNGEVRFRQLEVTMLRDEVRNPNDTLSPIDEQTDDIIRLQQQNFPVIDYHVHLKGGLTKEQAHVLSMHYGVNYGVAPNLGEGGVGRMLSNDEEAKAYYAEVDSLPFLMGAQGEGRRWLTQFSSETIGLFDYFFTDAMTVVDKGRICRIYRPEEVLLDGRTNQEYMDMIVEQTLKILTNEPADIYANATYIPEEMNCDYALYWTNERVDKVLDVLQKYDMALEISPRYKIPSMDVIKRAKARGIKFTFGTNNVNADFGKCEYAIQAIKECGLTAADIWFPSMSKRASRQAVNYNHF